MSRKTVIAILLVAVSCTSLAWASDANYYITVGRALMFDGTLSDLRLAYETFDNGLNDPGCPDCNTSRELKFLHAVTRTAMLIIRDDNGSVDSVFELVKQFDIDVLGDYWAPYFEPLGLELDAALNQYDAYEIPAGAPDVYEIRNIIDTSTIPEIEAIIADLNSISDSPTFKIFLTPSETRIFFAPDNPGLQTDVEVDYGEVLILKGLLMALKAQLQAEQAYDMYTDANDMIIEKIYGSSFNINTDLLDPYPDFLKVLPTANDSNDGAAVLARARQDWIDAINYYLDAVDYIRSENIDGNDPQGDELLYIDPNDEFLVDTVNEKIIILRESLENDTIMTYPVETKKTYSIYDVNSVPIGQLVLVYDFIDIEGEDGSLTFTDNNLVPSPWEVEWFGSEETDWIEIELEYHSENEWGQGWFEGTLSQDGDITDGTFEYWGYWDDSWHDSSSVSGLRGELDSTQVAEELNVDLNPVYGSSSDVNEPRYVQPVNPRDLLPVFDEWNGAQPGTMGHGLGDDATLGGIIPDMNQYDWQVSFDLQPGGLFYLQEVYPWQVTYETAYGYVDIWLEHQLIFEDPMSDTWEDVNNINNVDIDRLYMGYDDNYLYGAIILYDYNSVSSGQAYYNLHLSYTADDESSLDSIRLEIHSSGATVWGQVCYMNDSFGYPFWECMGMMSARMGQNGIEFSVPWYSIPSYLPGRFISLNVWGSDSMGYNWNGEDNETHLQLGLLGTISGTVSYNAYSGAPIFVQAYTDHRDPEGSLVASTVITAPGPYILEGIGLGWEGYVRAFTPLFGFNIFDLGALTIQDSVPVFLWLENLDGVDLVLNNPTLLEKDICLGGEIDPDYEEDWYSFYAVQGGTYTLDVNRLTSQYACMTLYDRNGYEELVELYYWQTQQINWLCPFGGRYYVKVADGYYAPEGGTYQICMTSNVTCPRSDIGAPDWAGVEDCRVDFYDLVVLVSHWLDSCSAPHWCDESDFDESDSVNSVDFAILANEWLQDGTP